LSEAFYQAPDLDRLKAGLARARELHGNIFVQARFAAESKVSVIVERAAFYFVESVVCPYSNLHKNEVLAEFLVDPRAFLPARYGLSDLQMKTVTAQSEQLILAVKKIAAESFTDDRFHCDHNCDEAIANQRYLYWVEDMLADAFVRFDVLSYQGHPVAFMASRGRQLLLAGFAKKFVGSGMGEYFWLSVMKKLFDTRLDRVETLISTNNVRVMNLYAKIGFKFRFPQNTFHYWSKASGDL
jgi:RimJ/RimL family protein N-acetyltransferase